MVLEVDLTTLATTLDSYPLLKSKLGSGWLSKHWHVPAWHYGTHPFIVGLWPPPLHEEMATWERGIRFLEDGNISGRASLYARLRTAAEFRSLRTEIFLASYLIQKGFTLSFPKSNDRRMPDIRITEPSGILDIEVKGFERTTSVESLGVMLHALMMDEPYSLDLRIPDTTLFKRSDVETACSNLFDLLQQRPFSAGRRRGRVSIHIGETGHSLTLVSPHTGAIFVNTINTTYNQHDFDNALRSVQKIIVDKSGQVPDGGAVALDISRTDEALKWVARSLGDANIARLLWSGVPIHVHSLWLFYTPGNTEHPSMMHYSANPYANNTRHPVVEILRADALAERDPSD